MFENKQIYHYNEVFCKPITVDTHMNSQTSKLHKSKPDGVPALRRESRHKLIYLTKKLSPICSCSQRNLVFCYGVSPGIQTTLKNRPHAKQQMPISNKQNDIFKRFFSPHITLFGLFLLHFHLTIGLLVYYGLLFCVFISCVFMCLCISFLRFWVFVSSFCLIIICLLFTCLSVF